MAQTLARSLSSAEVERQARALVICDERAVYRALSYVREQKKRRSTVVCPVCGVTVHNAHVMQRYCTRVCARRAAYLAHRARHHERMALLRGELPPLPDPPPMPSKPRTRRRDPGS